jgi:hypothetical protein
MRANAGIDHFLLKTSNYAVDDRRSKQQEPEGEEVM